MYSRQYQCSNIFIFVMIDSYSRQYICPLTLLYLTLFAFFLTVFKKLREERRNVHIVAEFHIYTSICSSYKHFFLKKIEIWTVTPVQFWPQKSDIFRHCTIIKNQETIDLRLAPDHRSEASPAVLVDVLGHAGHLPYFAEVSSFVPLRLQLNLWYASRYLCLDTAMGEGTTTCI